jgi:hypothetical protein
MTYESDSLNTELVVIEEKVGLLVGKPITDPVERARVLKIRQMYVDAGLMPPLEDMPKSDEPKKESK